MPLRRYLSRAKGLWAFRASEGKWRVYVSGGVQVTGASRIAAGRDLVIRAQQFPVQLTVRDRGVLRFGDHVFINHGANILAAQSVTIGDHTKIADLAAIRDSDTHPVSPGAPVRTAPVVIGRNVWIGRAATVMPGVTIGDNAVVAAGAVVTNDVRANTVVGGVPARELREFVCEDGSWVRP